MKKLTEAQDAMMERLYTGGPIILSSLDHRALPTLAVLDREGFTIPCRVGADQLEAVTLSAEGFYFMGEDA